MRGVIELDGSITIYDELGKPSSSYAFDFEPDGVTVIDWIDHTEGLDMPENESPTTAPLADPNYRDPDAPATGAAEVPSQVDGTPPADDNAAPSLLEFRTLQARTDQLDFALGETQRTLDAVQHQLNNALQSIEILSTKVDEAKAQADKFH
jgi:hypothetical protein